MMHAMIIPGNGSTNFMETKRGKTPAMKEWLAVKKWTWEFFFRQRLRLLI